jgi:hypothetical protein
VVTTGSAWLPAGKQGTLVAGDVEVEVQAVTVEGQPNPTWVLVIASADIPRPPIDDERYLILDVGVREKLEAAIEVVADLAAIATRSSRSVSSPHPSIALTNLTNDDRSYLASADGFRARGPVRNRIVDARSMEDPALLDLLTDRRDGVQLMAEGLSSSHATGQFHEYIRVFERAFRRSSGPLVRPLSDFLAGATKLGYMRDEVNNWLRVIRHQATHADNRDELATARSVAEVVWRVEQAAFDVLFNKRIWRAPDSERRSAYEWRSGITPSGMFITQGDTPTMTMQWKDAFGVFPMYFGSFPTPPEWWTGTAASQPDPTVGDGSAQPSAT